MAPRTEEQETRRGQGLETQIRLEPLDVFLFALLIIINIRLTVRMTQCNYMDGHDDERLLRPQPQPSTHHSTRPQMHPLPPQRPPPPPNTQRRRMGLHWQTRMINLELTEPFFVDFLTSKKRTMTRSLNESFEYTTKKFVSFSLCIG